MRRKEELLHIVIEPDIEQKLLFLARGIPFLIDLAAEGEAREGTLAWIAEESVESLAALPKSTISERQVEFETHLVQYIEQQRIPIDRLSLVLGWVHPVDARLCSLLLDLTEEQARELIVNAQKNVPYIKTLANQQIKLHDQMERLVLDHIWKDIELDRKKRESERAVQYYQERLQELHKQGAIIGREIATSQTLGPDIFLKQQQFDREYWQIALQLLSHKLIADPNQSINTYCQLFDEAYELHQVNFLNKNNRVNKR